MNPFVQVEKENGLLSKKSCRGGRANISCTSDCWEIKIERAKRNSGRKIKGGKCRGESGKQGPKSSWFTRGMQETSGKDSESAL